MKSAIFLCLALFCFPTLALADLDEIVVTASTNVQDKPLAVSNTDFDAQWLEELYVNNYEAVALFVPGLYIQEQSVNAAAYAIRGMTTNNTEATRTPRISVWQHGMDTSRTQGAYTALYDINAVTVFKGPATSLFARGGQMGGVNIESALAEIKNTTKLTMAVGSNYDLQLTSMWNKKVTNHSAVRLSLYHQNKEGFILNEDTGEPINSIDTNAARLSFLHIFDNSQLNLQLTIEDNNNGTVPFQSFAYKTNDPFYYASINDVYNLYIKRRIIDVFSSYQYTFTDNVSAEAKVLFRHVKSDDVFDPDGTRLALIQAQELAQYDTQEYTYTVHFTDDHWKTNIGVGYFYEDVSVLFAAHINEQLAIRLPIIQSVIGVPTGVISSDLFDASGNPNNLTSLNLSTDRAESQTESVSNQTFSLFSDNLYQLTDSFAIVFGVRYSFEKLTTKINTPPFSLSGQPSITQSMGNLFLQPETTSKPTSSARSNSYGLSGRLGLVYKINTQVSSFLTYARGRRPTILNYTEQSVLEHLHEETVDSYEAGLNINLKDQLALFDISFYQYQFKHFATSTSGVSALQILSDDNASATVHGAELAYTQFLPLDMLLFSNISFNKALFDESAIVQGVNYFRYAPVWSGALSLSKDWAINNSWRMRSTLQEQLQTRIYFEDDNQSNNGNNTQGAYSLTHVFIDFTWEEKLTINAFIKNLSDKGYVIDAGNFGQLFGLPTFVVGMGRYVGLGVAYQF